jgi:hypothetical protein
MRVRLERAWRGWCRFKDRLPERWYRDVALVVIAALFLWSQIEDGNRQDTIEAQQDTLKTQQQRLTVVAKSNRLLTAQLCDVVVDSHAANQSRLATATNRLAQTRDYLKDPTSKKENPGLYLRVASGLPFAKAEKKTARKSVRALTPPPRCLRLLERRKASVRP